MTPFGIFISYAICVVWRVFFSESNDFPGGILHQLITLYLIQVNCQIMFAIKLAFEYILCLTCFYHWKLTSNKLQYFIKPVTDWVDSIRCSMRQTFLLPRMTTIIKWLNLIVTRISLDSTPFFLYQTKH